MSDSYHNFPGPQRALPQATLTHADLAWCEEHWKALDFETYDGPEDVMTSIGYVYVWLDGDITGYAGAVLASLDPDSEGYDEN